VPWTLGKAPDSRSDWPWGNIEGAYCFASLHGGICGSELVESDPHVRDGRGARALGVRSACEGSDKKIW
jgi:hypothetical protein